MANEKAAKPPAPSAMACGPALAANKPPVNAPATTLFAKSFLARYYKIPAFSLSSSTVGSTFPRLTDSIQHSDPE